MPRSPNFQFVDEIDRVAAESTGVVEVPAGLRDKQQLMQALVVALPLPDYFGNNWDALDECFRDRLLAESRKPLCLLHRDLPCDENRRDCRDYLSLLTDLLAWATETDGCEFTVVFPTSTAGAIEQLIGWNESS